MSQDENNSAADVSESIRKAASDDSGDRGARGGDDKKKMMGGGFGRKKACRFCTDSEFVMEYKNVRLLQSFLSEHGRIVPRRISGNCAQHQRTLTTSLKRARQLALLGYVTAGY